MNRLVGALLVVLACWCIGLTWVTVKNPTEALSPELQAGTTPVIAFVHGDSIQSQYEFRLISNRKAARCKQKRRN